MEVFLDILITQLLQMLNNQWFKDDLRILLELADSFHISTVDLWIEWSASLQILTEVFLIVFARGLNDQGIITFIDWLL
jgi:hypothetical protein